MHGEIYSDVLVYAPTMDPQRLKRLLMAVLALSFIVRVVLILRLKTYALPAKWEYEAIVNNLLAGKGYTFQFLNTTYQSFNTPLYGFLCAAVYAITGHSHFVMLLVQASVTVLLSLTIFAIGSAAFNQSVGCLAAACTAFHPGLLYYDVFNLLPLSIDSFLIAVTALLWLRGRTRPALKVMFLLGCVIGIGVLSRGIVGVLLPAIVGYFLLVRSLTITHRLKISACLIAGTFAVLSPWLIRNYLIHNQFVFVSSTSGENFWRGNNPNATGTSTDKYNRPIFELAPDDFKRKVYAMGEIEQEKFLEREALSFIIEHPAGAIRLYLRKVYYFWWFSPQSGINYPQNYLTPYKVFYSLMALFSVAGFAMAMSSHGGKARKSALILAIIPAAICFGQSIFYVEGRHRWVVEPLLLIFFSFAIVKLAQIFRRQIPRFRIQQIR